MDLSRITKEDKGLVVRVNPLGSEDPSFLRSESAILSKFSNDGRRLRLELYAIETPAVNVGSSLEGSEAADEPRLGPRLESMEVDRRSARMLGYTSLMVLGEGEHSAKKYVLHFDRMSDCEKAVDIIQRARVEESGGFLNFEHCAFLFNQRIFLSDERRLQWYAGAVRRNSEDFKGKVVLDVGCGLLPLSLFASRNEPKKIYAVDPAVDAAYIEKICRGSLTCDLEFYQARVEAVELPEKVDIIIADCFGEMLLHGQMLRSLLIARHRFLKADGKMFPARATLILRPFNIQTYPTKMAASCDVWDQPRRNRGLFSAGIRQSAFEARLYRPTFDTNTGARRFATCHEQVFDLATLTPEKLLRIAFPFFCTVLRQGQLRGFTFSFRLSFNGTDHEETLDAEYDGVPTRWQNVFCILPEPIAVGYSEKIHGNCELLANEFHSYDIEIEFDTHSRRKHYRCRYRLEYGSSIAKNI